jgi:SAM-dependent methyltransferase
MVLMEALRSFSEPPLALNAWLRYSVVTKVLRQLPDIDDVLEVGAGLGAVAVRLASRYNYVGLEPDAQCFEVAHKRLEALGRGQLLRGDISCIELKRQFDLICAFEVVEHLEDDVAELSSWIDHLRPGGWILISVPAFADRYGAADRMAGHYRRYDPEELKGLFSKVGLETPMTLLYGFPLGFLLEKVRNALSFLTEKADSWEERTAASGRWLQPRDGWGWLTMTLAAPFTVLQLPFIKTKFGTGLIGLARKGMGSY